jgi:hypothetical protein
MILISNVLTLSVPDEGYSNVLTLSVPDEGYSNVLTLSVFSYHTYTFCSFIIVIMVYKDQSQGKIYKS